MNANATKALRQRLLNGRSRRAERPEPGGATALWKRRPAAPPTATAPPSAGGPRVRVNVYRATTESGTGSARQNDRALEATPRGAANCHRAADIGSATAAG